MSTIACSIASSKQDTAGLTRFAKCSFPSNMASLTTSKSLSSLIDSSIFSSLYSNISEAIALASRLAKLSDAIFSLKTSSCRTLKRLSEKCLSSNCEAIISSFKPCFEGNIKYIRKKQAKKIEIRSHKEMIMTSQTAS